MKTQVVLPLVLLSTSICLAQAPTATIVDRGPHHRTFQWTEEKVWPDGQVIVEQHGYTELASGMHYLQNGEWQETREEIELLADGAAAMHGPHQVVFAPNLNTPGAVDLFLPDGKRLKTHVLGLAYLDTASQQIVLIGQVRDTVGELHPPNQVLYPDAFAGEGVKADVRYTYTKAGFEQDVVIHALPDPRLYNMDPATTLLESWTEALDPPQPVRQPAPRVVAGLDEADEILDFGSMQIGRNWGFPAGDRNRKGAVPVSKQWLEQDGRQFLIESVPYPAVQPELEEAPQAALPPKDRNAQAHADSSGQPLARQFPPAPVRTASTRTSKMIRMAGAPPPDKGFVLDYVSLNSSLTNYCFHPTWTYYISGPVYLYGTNNVLEGNTILKFAPNANATICVKGVLLGQTDSYRPAILTARDDHAIGERVGYGTLSGVYAAIALDFDSTTAGAALQHLRISYAATGIQFKSGSGHELRHIQLYNCGTGVHSDGTDYAMRNVLGWNLTNAVTGSGTTTGRWEHATFDQVTNLVSTTTLLLTNCLLTGVVNTNSFSGAGNVVLSSSNGVFKVVGGGRHYLADSSAYRDVGTTNIDATLAGELQKRTTYAPIVLTNLTVDAVLSPVAARDTDLPDAGYHYAPLDYLACGVTISSNVTALATNGAAVGIDYTSSSWGFILKSAKLLSEGGPVDMNRFVRAHNVQEQSGGNPGTRAWIYDGLSSDATCELRMRFTELSQLVNDGYQLYTGRKFQTLEWTHSALYYPSLVIDTAGGNTLDIGVTNTLMMRGGVLYGVSSSTPAVTVHVRNNLYRWLSLHFVGGTTNWTVRDTLFDHIFLDEHGSPVANSNNGYYHVTNALSGGTSDVTLTNLVYETGPLGAYYQPTNSLLIDVGSCNATNAGLYHFTTTTNQIKEATSTVDIGLHYVAVTNVAGVWLPIDTDGDGLPDYFEDRNGNGVLDTALLETDWTTYTTITNGLIGLQIFTPLK